MNYYGIDYDDNSLAHYGVLGMKWGVRKAESKHFAKTSRAAGARYNSKSKNATDKKTKAKYKKKADKAYNQARYWEKDAKIVSDYVNANEKAKSAYKSAKKNAKSFSEKRDAKKQYKAAKSTNEKNRLVSEGKNGRTEARLRNYLDHRSNAILQAYPLATAGGAAAALGHPAVGAALVGGAYANAGRQYYKAYKNDKIIREATKKKKKG